MFRKRSPIKRLDRPADRLFQFSAPGKCLENDLKQNDLTGQRIAYFNFPPPENVQRCGCGFPQMTREDRRKQLPTLGTCGMRFFAKFDSDFTTLLSVPRDPFLGEPDRESFSGRGVSDRPTPGGSVVPTLTGQNMPKCGPDRLRGRRRGKTKARLVGSGSRKFKVAFVDFHK
jgi:hypothetical protein